MEWKLQLVIVPVADVDRAKAFYADALGWPVDVDHRGGETFRVVQMTPPGSSCSITIGTGLGGAMEPGTLHGMHLVVDDITAAASFLAEQGVEIGDLHHFEDGRPVNGPAPGRGDYESFLSFHDPDGNTWVVQEVGFRRVPNG